MTDFGEEDLVHAAEAVIEKSKAKRAVAVSTAHAGWVAIELRRQLGERIENLVLLDWLVLDPPKPFLEGLKGLQSREHWREVRDGLFAMWLSGIRDARLVEHVRKDMGSYGYDMWARAGREIGAGYARFETPLKALASLRARPGVLHLFSIPKDEEFLQEQRDFAKSHPWFRVRRLEGKTHFPCLEEPAEVAAAIKDVSS
jgi:pimeloyl-ACP methyl ester carboxylesterase